MSIVDKFKKKKKKNGEYFQGTPIAQEVQAA